jgi:2,4-dienoyl-CoA reductase-like NADH-dependent reductase (Old Yellow Enzyme family)
LIRLYTRWGEGDIGIIVGGNQMIAYDALEAFGNPILCDNHDGRIEQYRQLVAAAKAHGSLFISQISHPGRQGGVALNPHPVSASDVQLKINWVGNSFAKPRSLSVPEIKELVKKWGETAFLCHEAGYDGVQVR